jgi:SAM-dependent methyltransferase
VVVASCPACGGAPGARYKAREMMYGTREEFAYDECQHCASLWLVDPPLDMGPYYQNNYYAFARHIRLPTSTGKRRLAASLMLRHRKWPATWRGCPPFLKWLAGRGVGLDARVCDVGCGSGRLPESMVRWGFREVWGFDPHMVEECDEGGLHLRRGTANDIPNDLDVLMMHHALEHTPTPIHELMTLREKVSSSGLLLLRLPLAGSHAWRKYGVNWVQLDPPRHLVVPSVGGLAVMLAATRWTIESLSFDSTEFQFWGSELYRRDVPLTGNFDEDGVPSAYAASQLAGWRHKAQRLNARGDGDSCVIVARPSDH